MVGQHGGGRYGHETPQEVGFAVKTPASVPASWPQHGAITFDHIEVRACVRAFVHLWPVTVYRPPSLP